MIKKFGTGCVKYF